MNTLKFGGGLLNSLAYYTRVGIQTVLFIYSADRHFESTRDARIDLRSGAMVEAQHLVEDPLPEDEAHIHAFSVFEPDLETQRCANCNDRVVTAR